jgi:NADH-quinone oxidoreductase subunit N
MMKWLLLAPELWYFFMAALFFALSMLARPNPRRDYLLALFLAATGIVVTLAAVRCEGTLFFEVFKVDLYSQVFKVMLAVGLFLIVSLCSELSSIQDSQQHEFYFLLSLCTMAMMILMSSAELLTLYMALELSSYALYLLVSLRKGHGIHMEAALKYFLVGAATSAVMLFGLACLYGATHTTYLSDLVQVMPGVIHRPLAFAGLLLTLCGFFFKLAVFPFHVWAPGVYQGAANQVTAYIATATKVAAVAILTRMVALGSDSAYLAHVLVVLSISSMTLGNLTAMVQRDMKRLLAYSAIAHSGYVLMGILSMNESGYAGAIFYAAAYMSMNFTCFLVLTKVAHDGRNLEISQLAGLHRRSPLLAMALMLGVFSLGGIPPTMGFTGKFFVFVAAMQKGYFYLVLVGMVNVLISLYYYALVVKAAFLQEPEEELPAISLSLPDRLLTGAMVIVLVVGGIFPQYLYTIAREAARLLL